MLITLYDKPINKPIIIIIITIIVDLHIINPLVSTHYWLSITIWVIMVIINNMGY